MGDLFLLTKCEDCTLNNSTKVSSYYTKKSSGSNLSKRVDLVLVLQSPGWDEVNQGIPLVGRSGQLIMPTIKEYSSNLYTMNVINCRSVDCNGRDRVPSVQEIKCCRGRFDDELKVVTSANPPRAILVFGAVAKKEVARVLKSNNIAIKVFNFDHPSYILRNQHLKGRYLSELHNNLKSIFNTNSLDEVSKNFVIYNNNLRLQFISDYQQSGRVGADIETNGKNIFADEFKIGTISISCNAMTYFFDLRNGQHYDVLDEILSDDKVEKIFADVLYDVVAIKRCWGIEVNGLADLFPLAFISDNTFNSYSLESIIMRYFPQYASYKSQFHSTLIDSDYLGAKTEELATYNNFDSFFTRTVYNFLYDKLDERVKPVFNKITIRLLPVLVDLKLAGMKVDVKLLEDYKKVFDERYKFIGKYFKEKYGILNVNSTPRIRKFLFEDLKLKPISYSKKTKLPSTDKETIERYKDVNPDLHLLYESRRLLNLLVYFIPSISNSITSDGLVHPNIKHYGVQTFRLACKSPNLQGIPRDETKIELLDKYPLRRLFMPRFNDSYIVELDYSQQEVRLIAELSKDKNMIQAFMDGKDIHVFVASLLFHKTIEEVTKFERQVAKQCNFGSIFGVSAESLASTLSAFTPTSIEGAQKYLNQYFSIFPEIKNYTDRQGRCAVRDGIIFTVLGRPRRFIVHKYNINDTKREGANFTIQCLGTDFTFLSLIGIHKILKEKGWLGKSAFILLTVYDSIIMDIKKEVLKEVIDISANKMSEVPKLLGFKVPFEVDVKIGKKWGEKLDIEEILK